LPLWPGKGRPAKRIIVQVRRDVRTPLRLTSGLLLHKDDGGYTQAAVDILRGGGALQL
jgi:tRNA1(Val) A37 N6-methylase TrmN6